MLKRFPKTGWPCVYLGGSFSKVIPIWGLLALNFNPHNSLLFQLWSYAKHKTFKIIKPELQPGTTRIYIGRLEIQIQRKI
jgi:hypothetical protein